MAVKITYIRIAVPSKDVSLKFDSLRAFPCDVHTVLSFTNICMDSMLNILMKTISMPNLLKFIGMNQLAGFWDSSYFLKLPFLHKSATARKNQMLWLHGSYLSSFPTVSFSSLTPRPTPTYNFHIYRAKQNRWFLLFLKRLYIYFSIWLVNIPISAKKYTIYDNKRTILHDLNCSIVVRKKILEVN